MRAMAYDLLQSAQNQRWLEENMPMTALQNSSKERNQAPILQLFKYICQMKVEREQVAQQDYFTYKELKRYANEVIADPSIGLSNNVKEHLKNNVCVPNKVKDQTHMLYNMQTTVECVGNYEQVNNKGVADKYGLSKGQKVTFVDWQKLYNHFVENNDLLLESQHKPLFEDERLFDPLVDPH